MKILSAFFALFCFASAYATELPLNCKTDNHQYKNDQIVLHTDSNHRPQLYMLHNISKKVVIINHLKQHPSASAGWSSDLRKDNWSALMVAQPKFSLVCMIDKDQKFIYVDCKKFIEACYFSDFKDDENNGSGTYWVAEDAPLKSIMHQIAERKIQLGVSDTPS